MQGLDDYRNKQKYDWRGWQWNRIVERLSVPVEEALVLYLCGPEDLDRGRALDRGFTNENLIAVDVVEDNIHAVRSQGGLGVCHELTDLVDAWPKDWPINVIVADFCAGLTSSVHELYAALARSYAVSWCGHGDMISWNKDLSDPFTVVSVNLQRGRDPFANWIREHFNEKHRGRLWHAWCLNKFMIVLNGKDRVGSLPGHVAVPQLTVMHRVTDPAFNDYKSSRVYMDSCVMRWPSLPAAAMPERQYSDAARRKITACRAVRTRKMREAA